MKQYEAEQVVDRLKGSDSDIEYIKNLNFRFECSNFEYIFVLQS